MRDDELIDVFMEGVLIAACLVICFLVGLLAFVYWRLAG
jgi:hypothetical protein